MATDTNSLSFTAGSSMYADSSNTTIGDSQSQLTLEAWIKPTTTGAINCILSKWITDFVFIATIDSGPTQTFYVATDVSGNAKTFYANAAISTGVWTHIAYVFDGTQGSNANRGLIYINTVAIGTNVDTSFPAATRAATRAIQMARYSTSNYFDGLIDE